MTRLLGGLVVPVSQQPQRATDVQNTSRQIYTREAAARRRQFIEQATSSTLGTWWRSTGILPGNIENFTGVAQCPGLRWPHAGQW